MKILLAQLGANGDCLYASVIARQIKTDYPDCELTWAIASRCSHLLINNPYVDEIWQWDIGSESSFVHAWDSLERGVLRIQNGDERFDRIVLSQILPNNVRFYDGTIRPSILRAYGSEITVPIDSVIELTDEEHENVRRFADANGLDGSRHCVLFECSPSSGQSHVSPRFALNVIRRVSRELPECRFVLTTHERVRGLEGNTVLASELTMRENAALTRYCTLFVGCGSGLTVVSTSSAAKPLPNIQVLNAHKSVYASFHHDFEYFGKPADRFIEMGGASTQHVAEAIIAVCRDGAHAAREAFHAPVAVNFNDYLWRVQRWGLMRGKYVDALESLQATVDRYGWCDQLRTYLIKRLARKVMKDPLTMDKRNATRAADLLDRLVQSV